MIRLWKYSSRNTPATAVEIGNLTLYFSYETIVAFRHKGMRIVSKNIWSNTTGRHLNEIDGGMKENRYEHDDFKRLLDDALKEHGLL
jgi:hypothetical protein